MKETREALAANGEEAFAVRFDEWWELFRVEPIAPEITVWNNPWATPGPWTSWPASTAGSA